MPTGPQYSDELNARRKRVTVNVDLETMRLAKGAWKWAYLARVVDEASFGDWINAALASSTGDAEAAAPSGRNPRMYWIDRDKLDLLDRDGSRSQAFRAAIIEATAQLLAAAEEHGVTIEPIDRLPSKIWRE